MAPSGPSAPPLDRALVCMATYNERENLVSLIQEIHKVVPAVDVLVIDDNSPDGTGQIADQLAAADPRVHVIHRAGKLGLGTAIVAAMRYAIDKNYDVMVNMDAESYEALKRAADALHLRGRGAMIRALSQTLMHKDIAAVRRFLFIDEGDLPRKP